MFIRTFIEAETKMEAEKHLKNLFAFAEKVHLILEVRSFERYWKLNDSFQI